MEEVKLPKNLDTIGAAAFIANIKLPAIDLPASVRTLGPSAFMQCISLKEIDIPSGVTAIYDSLFYQVDDIDIYMPGTVEFIYDASVYETMTYGKDPIPASASIYLKDTLHTAELPDVKAVYCHYDEEVRVGSVDGKVLKTIHLGYTEFHKPIAREEGVNITRTLKNYGTDYEVIVDDTERIADLDTEGNKTAVITIYSKEPKKIYNEIEGSGYDDYDGDCLVEAMLASTYTVKLPAEVELEKVEGNLWQKGYVASAKGNITNMEKLIVKPYDDTMTLKNADETSVDADVVQEKIEFLNNPEEGQLPLDKEEYTDTEGEISATITRSGAYEGKLVFSYGLKVIE